MLTGRTNFKGYEDAIVTYRVSELVLIIQTLKEMMHPQPLVPIQMDNLTVYVAVNNKIQPKARKTMDMQFYWLKDREEQKQFKIDCCRPKY